MNKGPIQKLIRQLTAFNNNAVNECSFHSAHFDQCQFENNERQHWKVRFHRA